MKESKDEGRFQQAVSKYYYHKKERMKEEEAYNWKELYERNSILFHSEATYISVYHTVVENIHSTQREREGEHYIL